jgi:hypothetical protein
MSFYKVQADGTRVPAEGGGELSYIYDIVGATTLRVEDSGRLLVLNAAAGAVITAPAITATWNFKIRTGLAFATTDWTFVVASNVIQGNIIVAGANVPASNENTISFVATAESLGDFIEVECDGTNVYVNGVAATSGAITATAP